MTFQDDMAADLADVFDPAAFAIPVGYTVVGTVTVLSINVLINAQMQDVRGGDEDGVVLNEEPLIAIRTSDIAAPTRGDVITVATGNYAMLSPLVLKKIEKRSPGMTLARFRSATHQDLGGAGAHQVDA